MTPRDQSSAKRAGKTFAVQAAAFVFFFVVACALTYPAIFHLKGHSIGENFRSTVRQEYFQEWNLLHGVAEGRPIRYYQTDLVNYPYGQNIGEFIGISLNLYFYLPLAPFLDLFGRTNLLEILFLTCNGFFMFRFVRRRMEDDWLALACGFFFLFSPYSFLKLNQGFQNKLMLFWIPLFWDAVLRVRSRGRVRDGFLAGVWLVAMLWSYPQYGYYAAMFLGFYGLYVLLKRERFGQFAIGMVPTAALTGAAIWAMQAVVHVETPPPQVLKIIREQYFLMGVFDISAPFRFFPYATIRMGDLKVPYPVGLTVLLPALGLIGAWLERKRESGFYLIAAAAFVLLSMGSVLAVGGHVVQVRGYTIPLPFAILDHFPFSYRLMFPLRTLPFTFFCLAILAAFALAKFADRTGVRTLWLALAAMFVYTVDNLLLLPELYPAVVEKAEIPAWVARMRHEPGTAFLNYPLPIPRVPKPNSDYIYYAAIAEKKLVNVYLHPRPAPAQSLTYSFPKPNATSESRRAFFCELAKVDVRHFVIHTRLLTDPTRELRDLAWVDGVLGPPERCEDGRFLLYRIPESPAFCGAPTGIPPPNR